MPVMSADALREIGKKLFVACGSPENEAALVAGDLVDASLMGLDSHGVARFAQYAEQARSGLVKPGAPVRVMRETPSTALVDCAWNFGIVGANRMTELAAEKASACDIACVTSRRAHHVGRLGAYVQKLAEVGYVALAFANSSRHGHWVAPWGGREGRLATNPLAFGAPTSGNPVVLDMSTSMIAEGKIRLSRREGKPLPEGCVLDAQGRATTDPNDFYGPPMGTILPFGGALGYKGFGLGLMVEILGSTLGGIAVTPDGEKDDYMNGFTVIAIRPGAFSDGIHENMDRLCEYVTSCPPREGGSGVVMPGYYDFATRDRRRADGIPVADEVLAEIRRTGKILGVEIH